MTTLQQSVAPALRRPRVHNCPPYQFTSGPEAAAIYESTGRKLDDWQKRDLDDHCAENADGTWLTLESVEEVSRQNGKGEEINAIILLHLFVLGTQTVIYSAHEFKTAKESYLKLFALIRNTPHLHAKVKYYHNSNEDTSIALKSGQRVRFLTRSKDGGRGFTGDVIIFDEAFNIAASALSALLPTLSSKPNPHIYYFSSAGKASEESDVLRELKKRGEEGDLTLVYLSYSAPENAETDDRSMWALANPALGVRITERFVEVERKNLTEVEFRRERMGIWDKPKGMEAAFPRGVWERQVADAGHREITSQPILAVDMRTGMDQSVAIAVAGGTDHGFGLIHIARYHSGADEQWAETFVFDEAMSIRESRGIDSVAIDAYSENESLIRRFEDAGVPLRKLNTRDMANGAVGLTDALVNDRVRHTNSDELNTAVGGAAKRTYGEVLWMWSQAKSAVDITTLRAATVAWWVYSSEGSDDYDVMDSFF